MSQGGLGSGPWPKMEVLEGLEGLEAPGGPWRPLEAPRGPWRPLEAPGGPVLLVPYWDIHTICFLDTLSSSGFMKLESCMQQ